MKEMQGIELLREIKQSCPDTNVILMTAFGSVETAIETMKQGAYDHLTKPVKTDELVLVIEKAVREAALRREVNHLRRDPETLLESKLFGHVRGSFTDAHASKKGLFEEADGGTIFLDEIADTTAHFQAKLRRVLQEGEIKPVGSTSPVKVDARVISATNKDLLELVKTKAFREDLYYRLAVLPLSLPCCAIVGKTSRCWSATS
jgi:DNA-binding NtrC family response regulator